MHQFKITYHEGIPCIENFLCDHQKIINNLYQYNIKIFKIHEKQKLNLKHNINNFGMTSIIQNYSEDICKDLLADFQASFNTWQKPLYYKFLIPYHIEISYNNELLLSDALDLRNKLILFNLESDDMNDLNVWMNAIGIFKKKMNCDIAIKNDIINSMNYYDDIVDIKYKKEEPSIAHYYMLNIGRYYLPNSNIANPYYHPDGLKNKNALEIINDILYFSGDLFIE